MSFSSEFALVSKLVDMSVNHNGAYERLTKSMNSLSQGLQQYFKILGTPADVKERLIGHRGLEGETNNAFGMYFNTIVRDAHEHEPQALRPRAVYSAFTLSRQLNQSSFLARCENTDETLEQAFDRITNDITDWLDSNASSIPPDDLDGLNMALIEFEYRLAEIKDFIHEAQEYFEDHKEEYTRDSVMAAAFPNRPAQRPA